MGVFSLGGEVWITKTFGAPKPRKDAKCAKGGLSCAAFVLQTSRHPCVDDFPCLSFRTTVIYSMADTKARVVTTGWCLTAERDSGRATVVRRFSGSVATGGLFHAVRRAAIGSGQPSQCCPPGLWLGVSELSQYAVMICFGSGNDVGVLAALSGGGKSRSQVVNHFSSAKHANAGRRKLTPMTTNKPTPYPALRRIPIIISPVIGVVLVLLATARYGAGLSPDSVGYITVARSLVVATGIPPSFISQPPLFPAILAAAGYVLQADPLFIAHLVNAFVFGLIICLSTLLFFKHLYGSAVLAFMGTIYVVFSEPLLEVSVMAWTEPLFVCFVVGFLISLHSYLEKRSRISFALSLLLSALACLTRYIGVTLVFTGVVAMLLCYKGKTKGPRWTPLSRHAGGYG